MLLPKDFFRLGQLKQRHYQLAIDYRCLSCNVKLPQDGFCPQCYCGTFYKQQWHNDTLWRTTKQETLRLVPSIFQCGESASHLRDANDAIQLPVIPMQPQTSLHEAEPTPHPTPDDTPTNDEPSMPKPTPIETDTKAFEDMTHPEKIYHLRDQGLSYSKIVKKTGFSEGKIRHHLRKRGVNGNTRK